jgi:hypothetical protein
MTPPIEDPAAEAEAQTEAEAVAWIGDVERTEDAAHTRGGRGWPSRGHYYRKW